MFPLRFEPIYQYRLWDGRRLANLLSATLPNDGPFGEAWILSDRGDHASQMANGSLKGQTLCQLEVDQALACIDFVDGVVGVSTFRPKSIVSLLEIAIPKVRNTCEGCEISGMDTE